MKTPPRPGGRGAHRQVHEALVVAVLVVGAELQGAVDELLTAAHFEAWRAAIAATGRSADGVEIGFTDAFFRCVDAGGAIDVHGEEGRSLLADAVASWVARTVTPAAGARRAR
jgi:hypothetical protein